MRDLGARRSGPSPRTRVVVPVEYPLTIDKEAAPCCVAQRDDLGRLPIGFCGEFCIRRSMRFGLLYRDAARIWRKTEGVAS